MKASHFLDFLNDTFYQLHNEYETLFWQTYMGLAKVGKKKDTALAKLNAFRSSREHKQTAERLAKTATPKERERLATWVRFFDLYQTPDEAVSLQIKINALESEIQAKRAAATEGYIDPHTKVFTPASMVKMATMISTHSDEAMRKACFDAREKAAHLCLSEYVTLVGLRNEFAVLLGYSDFYDYKLRRIDGMTKDDLFGIFESITEAAKPNKIAIRELEKTTPGLRKPWNFAYLMASNFVTEEDQYFPFTEAVPRWVESFTKLGIGFAGGKLTLDLVERKGKYSNAFCHWPELVHYKNTKRQPGSANFTCNVTPSQVGSGFIAYQTLFHEGGHAAHFLNITERDVCLNHEYAPMTAAWAETQSMFMDTMLVSREWCALYAKNVDGVAYPADLFERKTKATNLLQTNRTLSLIFLVTFERRVYELKKPTADKILKIAKTVYREIFDQSSDSLRALNTPHIYAWESACAYHGYGLAEVALHQWRDYFHRKYGYIVDNPQVGKEMIEAWASGSRYDFKTAVRKVTGKKLSAVSLIKHLTRSPEKIIRDAKTRMDIRSRSKTKSAKLNATIELVHGKKCICMSEQGLPEMNTVYKKWYGGL